MLCIKIGNSSILAGVYQNNQLIFTFRFSSRQELSSINIQKFILDNFSQHNFDYKNIHEVKISSVVPKLDDIFQQVIHDIFNLEAKILTYNNHNTDLEIKYKIPHEVGTDLIANSIAAINLYKNKNVIIVDLGTASTIYTVNKKSQFLAGVIFPGIKMSLKILGEETAQLDSPKTLQKASIIGKNTQECIQAGIYYATKGAIKEIIQEIKLAHYNNEDTMIIGTGGLASIYAQDNIFDIIKNELILEGLRFSNL